jgi:hypothetical protein
MSQKILILPNTLQRAYAGIDELSDAGALSDKAAVLLKALYAHGWDDGVVCLNAGGLALSSGMTIAATELAMYELLCSGLARLRTGGKTDVIELVVLANLEVDVWSKLAWWHYCVLGSDEAA